MRCTKLFLTATAFLLLYYPIEAQQIIRLDSGKLPVVCFAGNGTGQQSRISAPDRFLRGGSGEARTKTAAIEVEYFGFSTQARQAFEFATAIWESLLTSPVSIRVAAVWTNLPEGTLGTAGPSFWAANFERTPKYNIYYPGPLAEKLAGQELNNPDEYDIVAQFNSSANWHYESTGTPEPGEFDLITVVLHELGHGLGFTGTFEVEGDVGMYGRYTDNGVPFCFDVFLENGTTQNLYEDFASPSSALATQLTGNDLFFSSPFDAGMAKLFAPAIFSEGSSISHLDPSAFPQGTANSLMRPFINPNEVNHDPGDITQKIFSDMGWVTTYIVHDHLKDREDVSSPIEVRAIITPDNTPDYDFNEDQVILSYSRSDIPGTTQLIMQPTGIPNEFAASLPAPQAALTYSYNIMVTDNLGRTLYSPGEFYEPGADPGAKGPLTSFYSFTTGPDTDAPEIAHTPKAFISYLDEELVIDVDITEANGISKAGLEFILNDDPAELSDLTLVGTEVDIFEGTTVYRYRSTMPIAPGQLQDGDEVRYRIQATDNAVAANETTLPVADYFHIPVEGLAPSRTYYINDFDLPSDDFIGTDFTIRQEAGFGSPAIHSLHPYPEAGSNNQIDIAYQLRIPIIVSNIATLMTFDEVAIVEPGEDGSVFGQPEFFDYVVVEGSKDGGESWTPLSDGYDSRDNSIWLSVYNGGGAGNETHFRTRTIDLLDKFSPGDEVVFRFRLFSDAFGNGWGWAIDNLQIQVDDKGPEVLHNHIDYVLEGTLNLPLPATVSDDQLVDKITFEYKVDEQPPAISETVVSQKESLIDFVLDISELNTGSTVYYRYTAIDSAGNKTFLPGEGYFNVPVIHFAESLDQYANSFDSPSTDFAGNFFQVAQPDNFTSSAMHTTHPYPAGFGSGHKSDFALTLLKKIRINDTNPYMKFDEIALVQPAEDGAVPGTPSFNDYVIVEASKDEGKTWHPLQEGYDASSRSEWLAAYEASGSATGELFRQRGIDLTGSGDFAAGDEILIRFRLFSDESDTGWGWAIGNLHIQDKITGLDPDGLISKLLTYPNPVTSGGTLILVTQTRTQGLVTFTILNSQGSFMEEGQFTSGPEEDTIHTIALDTYSNGMYLLHMNFNGKRVTRKFVVLR
jgi:hypothetical protein